MGMFMISPIPVIQLFSFCKKALTDANSDLRVNEALNWKLLKAYLAPRRTKNDIWQNDIQLNKQSMKCFIWVLHKTWCPILTSVIQLSVIGLIVIILGVC